MFKNKMIVISVFTASSAILTDWASACSATNDVGDTCEITCSTGQAAQCANGSGASKPECRCEGAPSSNETFAFISKEIQSRIKSDKRVAQWSSNIDARVDSRGVIVTDAIAAIDSKLLALRNYNIRYIPNIRIGGRPALPMAGQILQGKLKVKSPLSFELPPVIQVKEPDWKEAPVDYIALEQKYRNCSQVAQSQTFTHTKNIRVGARLQNSRTINMGSEQNLTLSFNYSPGSAGGLGFGGSTGVKFTNSFSITGIEEQNFETMQTLTEQIPVIIPAMSLLILRHSWIRRVVPLEYTGKVQLNGSIIANLENISLASQLIPDQNERTFEISGKIQDANVVQSITDNNTTSLTPQECSSSAPLSVLSEDISLLQ